MLYQRIRERFLQLIKLRINLINVEPLRKLQLKQERLSKRKEVLEKAQEKKRNRKMQEKKREEEIALARQSSSGPRTGLRTRETSQRRKFEQDSSPTLGYAAKLKQSKQTGLGEEQEHIVKLFKDDLSELERTINEEAKQYFKLGNPVHTQDLDWAITFSKFNFPWPDVAFSHFSAKDCYIKYTSTVREARVFYKKILQNKSKYLKYVDLEEAPRFNFESSCETPPEEG